MASAAIFASLRRRRSPSLEAFLSPVDLTGVSLVQTLATISTEIVSSFNGKPFSFQRKNARSLIRKIEFFVVFFEYLADLDSGSGLPSTAVLCFKELYMLLHRCKILLDYCARSSKLWLLLQNPMISDHFHDLNREISTLLDVLPIDDIRFSDDIREQILLLHTQSRKLKLRVDKSDESLRIEFYSFLHEFEKGKIPNPAELKQFFVEKLGIRDSKSCRDEIEFLEEQIVNHEGDSEPTATVLNGFVAIIRYCRFLLFGLEDDDLDLKIEKQKNPRKGLIVQEIGNTFTKIPKDFFCPISLDLMKDPVIISTGQTYDRSSIARWIEDGHSTCPKTGQMFSTTVIVSNRALKNLIMLWCTANGIMYDAENPELAPEGFASLVPGKAEIAANKASVMILVQQLADGSETAQSMAAGEIRLLAKTGMQNRAFIAEAGAIPHLQKLLKCRNPISQENSVTAMLNLSIYERNKSRIMEEEGCLESIVNVLFSGLTTAARENAAATLFSLSAVHDYKKRIADEERCIEALTKLLRDGTPRGKKDAIMALFNLSTHIDSVTRMIEGMAVSGFVDALGDEGVAEEAAGALALIVRQPVGAEAVAREETAVSGLVETLRCGTPRGKENAVVVLLELCRQGGAAAVERVLRTPALVGLLQIVLFTGTNRARRKAASLARVFRRCENAAFASRGYGDTDRDTIFMSDVSMGPMSISVHVL